MQNVINKDIFKPKQDKIALESISQSHRVEKPTSGCGPCDIIANWSVIANGPKSRKQKKFLRL